MLPAAIMVYDMKVHVHEHTYNITIHVCTAVSMDINTI